MPELPYMGTSLSCCLVAWLAPNSDLQIYIVYIVTSGLAWVVMMLNMGTQYEVFKTN